MSETLQFTGKPDDMEVAKRLIFRGSVNVKATARVASDHKSPKWSRIAAIYALGFIDQDNQSAHLLTRIAEDPFEAIEIRDHAVEALGEMHAVSAIPALVRLYESGPEKIRVSCKYALDEMYVDLPGSSQVTD